MSVTSPLDRVEPGQDLPQSLSAISARVDKARRSDALVLGGGVIGLAIAYLLAKRGANVTLLEASELGSGTSGRCDGNALVQTKNDEELVRLTLKSIDLYSHLSSELPISFGFEQKGSLVLIERDSQLSDAKRRADWLVDLGVPTRYVTPERLSRLEPSLAVDLSGAIECDADASVYPPLVVASLAVGAASLGAQLVTHVRVLKICLNGNGAAIGVDTSEGHFTSGVIINALGVWAPAISESIGVNLPIKPRQGVLLATAPIYSTLNRNVTDAGYLGARYDDDATHEFGIGFIAEPTMRNNLLIGSSRTFSGFSHNVSSEVVDAIARRALRFLPGLMDLQVIRTFAGLRPWTVDHRPIVGSVDEVPGYFVACGHEGEGIGLAPVTAELIADLVCGVGAGDIGSELNIRRFRMQKQETP